MFPDAAIAHIMEKHDEEEKFRRLVERFAELHRRVNREVPSAVGHGVIYMAGNLWAYITTLPAYEVAEFGRRDQIFGFPVAVDRRLNDDQIVWRLEVRG